MAKGHGSDGMTKAGSMKSIMAPPNNDRALLQEKVEKVYQDQRKLNDHLALGVLAVPDADTVRLFHEAQNMITDIIRFQNDLLRK